MSQPSNAWTPLEERALSVLQLSCAARKEIVVPGIPSNNTDAE
jgi:hypothetical protein